MSTRKKIALMHRYGAAVHSQECHAIPPVIEALAKECEVHYFGPKPNSPTPPSILNHAVMHTLPFSVTRASTRDKVFKTFLWYVFLPFISLRCRFMGVHMMYIDESLPLNVFIARVFFGRKIAIAVADVFLDIYLERFTFLRPICRLMKALDVRVWKSLPLIFTKVIYMKNFLVGLGVPAEHIIPVYNPCDLTLYYPQDKLEARKALGLAKDDFIIAHHGILHPNKGNDRIIRALSEIRQDIPSLRFLLIGSGPEMENLKQLARTLNMEDAVTFTGWLPTEKDVCAALNAADVGLVMRVGLESDNYHVTATLVHEMACGLPILSAHLAGVAEIIQDGKTGFLFAPDDMEAFKSKLLKLARQPELIKTFGRHSLTLCKETFEVGKISAQITGALLELLNKET